MLNRSRWNCRVTGVVLGMVFLVFLLLLGGVGLAQNSQGLVLEMNQPVLVVEPPTATVFTGNSQQYRAYLSHDNGVTLGEEVTEMCAWFVEDISIGEASAAVKGAIRGVSTGQTTVRALYVFDSLVRAPIRLEGEAQMIVRDPRVWLEILPPTATIEVGETQQYRAYLKSTDIDLNEDVTEDAQWWLAEDIATATGKGKYRGDREGNSSITANYDYTPPYSKQSTPLSANARLTVWEGKEEPPDDTPDEDVPDEDEDTPETEDLPEGKMLDRQPGYITLSTPQKLAAPGAEFTLTYDQTKMDGNPDRYPKVFYWNDSYDKWVALASYPLTPGTVKAVNDGSYAGWFVVFGCIQPRFTDITTAWEWAEPIANRMNGLGLLEGYPNPDDPTSLIRPAGLSRTITRAELTTVVARILGLAPGETHLYPTITYMTEAENDAVLQAKYNDADLIAPWSRPFIAAMTKADLVKGKGDRFAPQDQMTRIEAAVLISNALRNVPGFGHPADLSVFTDADQVPSWAIGQVAEGTIGGYPDGSLRPNVPINRAESMVLLLKLLRGLGW